MILKRFLEVMNNMGTCNDCKHNHVVWDPELGEFGGYPEPCYSCEYPKFNNWEPKEKEETDGN